MGTDADWFAARTTLRSLMDKNPTWSIRDLAQATNMSYSWAKKWRSRIVAAPDDPQVLSSRSRAPQHPPPKLDPLVLERILDLRDNPPKHLHRIPGPRAICYFLAHDPELLAAGVRIPTSSRTVWRILRAHGRIALPLERVHHSVERPEPFQELEWDYKDASTVEKEPDGKRQHVVEILNCVDRGTSILVDAQVQSDFTAETTLEAFYRTLSRIGLPHLINLDRDPRFVGSAQGSDFPAPLVRMLMCLGIQVTICPARRPDKNGFVERFHRTLESECLRIAQPRTLEQARAVIAGFREEYNWERPNQAVSCQNRPPRVAFPDLPALPALPEQVDPDRWVEGYDGQRITRKVNIHGFVRVDSRRYYVDQSWSGRYVTLRIDGPKRSFVVEYREKPIGKVLPIRGLVNEILPLEVYIAMMVQEARTQNVGGRPVGQQLVLPLTNV